MHPPDGASMTMPPRQDRAGGLYLQGYLAHTKRPPPSWKTEGPYAYSYCRVLGGRCFL